MHSGGVGTLLEVKQRNFIIGGHLRNNNYKDDRSSFCIPSHVVGGDLVESRMQWQQNTRPTKGRLAKGIA